MPRRGNRFAVVLIVLGAVLASRSAVAKPSFPDLIAHDLNLPYQVPCSICHVKGNTGSGTANTPFALSLRARGLTGEGENSLASALSALETEGVDSDGDGESDVTELRAGTDPNSSTNASLAGDPDPGYGCGGSPPRGHRRGAAPLAGIGLLGWLLRRRGRRAA
jgi:hypothetical protein